MRSVTLKLNDRPRTRARFGAAGRWACAVMLAAALGVASAKDSLMASAYAPVVRDLMEAFGAVETLCPLATFQHDVCFEASPAGASQLAEQLAEVVSGYEPADLRVGDWRSANGVWAVTLRFGSGAYGAIDLYLAEVGPGAVRGTFIFHEPR